MVGQVLDERRIPSLAGDLAVAHCRYSTTGSTIWENAQPTLRLGPRRALAIGHNGNLVNTRELLDQLEGGRGRLAGDHGHGAPDRAPRRRAGGGHGGGPRPGAAARPGRVQPRDPRRAPRDRRPRPARLPAARPRPAADPRVGGRRRRACGTTRPAAGSSRRRRRRWTSSARTTCATWSRARSSCSRRARSRARCAMPRRRRPCACSSSSTSPARTRTWRGATCTRRGARWGCSSRTSIPSTRTS